MQKIIKDGIWRYSEDHFEKIIIVEQDWDQFYEEGYNEDLPYLNSDGLVYYLHFGDYWFNEFGNISSRGVAIPFLSQIEAEEYAKNEFRDLKWQV